MINGQVINQISFADKFIGPYGYGSIPSKSPLNLKNMVYDKWSGNQSNKFFRQIYRTVYLPNKLPLILTKWFVLNGQVIKQFGFANNYFFMNIFFFVISS